jgi:hypothetical protein
MKTKRAGYEGEGYLMVKVYGHPLLPDGTKIAQHRLKMINRIKRLLRKDEVVHHIDENIMNNRISNLQLMTKSEHSRIHHIGKHYHSKAQKQKWSAERRGKRLKGKILRERQASMRRAGMISAAKRKGKPLPEAQKQKIREGVLRHGPNAGTFQPGHQLSKATKKKLAKTTSESWKDPEVRENRIKNSKLRWTPERRAAQAKRCRLVGKRRAK